jgi:hypothetical protein
MDNNDGLNDFLSQKDKDEIISEYAKISSMQVNPATHPWICRFTFHRFTKWWIYRSGDLQSNGDRLGFYASQARICTRCGMITFRSEKCT